jgi:putative metallohydrolase (TIGR04338 family)
MPPIRAALRLNADEAGRLEAALAALERAVADDATRGTPVVDWAPDVRRLRAALVDAQNRAAVRTALAAVGKRDTQRARVYRVEESVAAVGGGDDLMAVAEAEAFVSRVVNHHSVRVDYPRLDPTRVVLRTVARRATATCRSLGPDHTLTVPRTHLTRRILLHELAHAAANAHFGKLNIAGHGPEFAAAYLRLVGTFLGEAAHQALAQAFVIAGVTTRFTTRPLPLDAPGARSRPNASPGPAGSTANRHHEPTGSAPASTVW